MQIVLTAVDKPLLEAWQKYCGDFSFVKIHHGSILDVECDAVVSPANSFGFMDGGIDAIYMDYFGSTIQTKLRKQIFECNTGELLVGQADIIETGDENIPFLIAAPTMRVPMILRDSVNPYLAARATLLLVTQGSFRSGRFIGQKVNKHINTIALPGLGTGVGRIGPNTCAHQVRTAIKDVILNEFSMPQSWAEASERHQLLYTDTLKRLQHET